MALSATQARQQLPGLSSWLSSPLSASAGGQGSGRQAEVGGGWRRGRDTRHSPLCSSLLFFSLSPFALHTYTHILSRSLPPLFLLPSRFSLRSASTLSTLLLIFPRPRNCLAFAGELKGMSAPPLSPSISACHPSRIHVTSGASPRSSSRLTASA